MMMAQNVNKMVTYFCLRWFREIDLSNKRGISWKPCVTSNRF